MEALKTIEYRGCNIEIYYDEHAEGPEQWEDEGAVKLISFNRRYGNNHGFSDPQEAIEHAKANNMHVYQIRSYIHSGIALSLGSEYPFNDRFDSGFYGLILVTKDESIIAKPNEYAESYIKSWNTWANGEVRGFMALDKDGEDIDSCWGFYDEKHMLEEAKSNIDYHIKEQTKKHCQQVKSWIKNKVPLANK